MSGVVLFWSAGYCLGMKQAINMYLNDTVPYRPTAEQIATLDGIPDGDAAMVGADWDKLRGPAVDWGTETTSIPVLSTE